MLPSRISPDNLKDAVVQVSFTSPHGFGTLAGIILTALEDFEELRLPQHSRATEEGKVEFLVPRGADLVRKDQKLRITIQTSLPHNQLIFNIVQGYIGWQEYKPAIAACLTTLMEKGIIADVHRIGMRYISNQPDWTLASMTTLRVANPFVEEQHNTSYHTEFARREKLVIVNLHEPLLLVGDQANHLVQTDIDVVEGFIPPLTTVSEVLTKIETSHQVEKEVFWSLMSDDFKRKVSVTY